MAETGVERALARAQANFDGSVERLKALLRLPSIGTDPAYDGQTRATAQWLSDELAGLGFQSRLVETGGQPCVLAHYEAAGSGPRPLYYGHYDVQPADPLDLWESPPFEPTIVDGPRGKRVVARGAVDDKGQLMTFIEAFRAWKEVHGSIPVPVTVVLEGEEESGSRHLEPFLDQNRAELGADVCVISDTGMLEIDKPAITYMLRGMLYVELTLKGPSHDLHSGMYGGAVANPNNALARIIAATPRRGRPGADPGLLRRCARDRRGRGRCLARHRRSEADFLATAGLRTPVGEKGRTLLERTWSRPTCDVNGIWGGYTGAGAQDRDPGPGQRQALLSPRPRPGPGEGAGGPQALHRAAPAARLQLRAAGVRQVAGHPRPHRLALPRAARRAACTVFGREPVLIGCGGSIPVVGSMQRLLGLDTVFIGFGLDDDRVHSPNEKFELVCFERGIRTHVALLGELAAA